MASRQEEMNTIPNDNTIKILICRAVKCRHNLERKPLCTLDMGLEIEDDGRCIHFDKSVITHPITGSIWEK